MLNFTQVLQELSTTLLAAGTGIFLYRRLNRFNRILLLQVIIYIAFDITGYMVEPYCLEKNNSWVYNLYMPVEVILLVWTAWQIFETKLARNCLLAMYLVFMIFYFMDIFVFIGFTQKLAYHAAVTEGILFTGVFLLVIYVSLMQKREYAPALAATGMILYFACTIPYLGNLFYFDGDKKLNDLLFQYLVVLFAFIRYFFIALAFFLQVYWRKQEEAIKKILP